MTPPPIPLRNFSKNSSVLEMRGVPNATYNYNSMFNNFSYQELDLSAQLAMCPQNLITILKMLLGCILGLHASSNLFRMKKWNNLFRWLDTTVFLCFSCKRRRIRTLSSPLSLPHGYVWHHCLCQLGRETLNYSLPTQQFSLSTVKRNINDRDHLVGQL